MFSNNPLDTGITKNTSDKSNVSDTLVPSVNIEETDPLKLDEAKENAQRLLNDCLIKRRNFKNGKK